MCCTRKPLRVLKKKLNNIKYLIRTFEKICNVLPKTCKMTRWKETKTFQCRVIRKNICRIPLLTKKNIKGQLQHAKIDLDRVVELWKNVLWSNVTKLELFEPMAAICLQKGQGLWAAEHCSHGQTWRWTRRSHFILSGLNDYVLTSKNKYNVLNVFILYCKTLLLL